MLAKIYERYTTAIVDDIGIEQSDEYVAGPVGNHLVLKFQSISPQHNLI